MQNYFMDPAKELFVITTITNWNEPPRMRHEIAKQLSKKFNVLFVQIYCQRGKLRKKASISKTLIVEKSGIFLVGCTRVFIAFPFIRRAYNKILATLIEQLVSKYGYKQAHLMNFQYDFPEIHDISIFNKKIHFCNDDFVNQNLNSSNYEIENKRKVQSEVVKKSDLLITASQPLKEKLEIYGTKTEIILSGHSFDLIKSKTIAITKSEIIDVCYMGFLNQYIAIDWFKYILGNNDIRLTAIGPIAYKYLREQLYQFPNFHHVEFLIDANLQTEMLKYDIMVMPYSSSVDNDVTTVPAKLFQYLAVGKPIVASNMKNLITLPSGFVYKASNQDDFLNLIRRAYHENSESLKNERINFASDHTWDQRGTQLLNMIKAMDIESPTSLH